MKLSPYITFKDGEEVYICQTFFPNYMARIRRFDDDYSLSKDTGIIKCQVEGYRILLSFAGTLHGNYVHMGDKGKELQKAIDKMTFWYFIYRVDPDQKRYAKWKLSSGNCLPGYTSDIAPAAG